MVGITISMPVLPVDKDKEILNALKSGWTVARVASVLRVGRHRVCKIRQEYADQIPARSPRESPRYSFRLHEFADRVAADIAAARVTVTDFFNTLVRDYYARRGPRDDRYNDYAVPGECGCDPVDLIRNLNGNLDRDELVCQRCGSVWERRA